MMQRLLSITLISLTADIVYTQEGDIREHQGPQICGGRLKGPVGVIQTPNFPNPFPVPIKFKWIIEHDIINGTISIYFTQQYTTSGLTFTEYMYYEESYKLGERKALTVTEENITKNNWLQGDNVSITCLEGAGRMHGVLGYSWTRERLLLQVPGLAVWAGSVLKLYNVQKSGEYRCQVSSVAGINTKEVIMWTLGPKDEVCESEASHEIRWPKTSPGAYATATCPPGHNEESVRFDVSGLLASKLGHIIIVNTSYWRAPSFESPFRLHRRQSTPDTRADIARCVEYTDSLLSQQRYDPNVDGQHLGDLHMGTTHVFTKHVVCDLIPHSQTPPQRPDIAHVFLELGALRTPPKPTNSLLTCSVNFKPCTGRHFDTSKDGCSICALFKSDVSKITSPPIKSCLKKPESDFSSSISLPSIELKEDLKSKSDIGQVNKEWNKEYEARETDRMLNKISDDLDFLLNRTQDKNIVLDQIEEAPT